MNLISKIQVYILVVTVVGIKQQIPVYLESLNGCLICMNKS